MRLLGTLFILLCGLAFSQERIGDEKIKLPQDWQQCLSDSDCEAVHYGCGNFSSAHHQHHDAAQAQAYKLGGDSRTMNCESGEQTTLVDIRCAQNRCGAYRYPLTTSCPFTLRSNSLTGGDLQLSASGHYSASNRDECEKKCEDNRLRRSRRLRSYPDMKWELVCSWHDTSAP